MNKKIEKVLNELQRKVDFEELHKNEINYNERMLSITKDTGIFYNMLLKTMHAKKVLEIGLSTGYSTLWFADAVICNNHKSHRNNALIITIENDPKKVKIAKKNFEKAGVSDIITIIKGDAKNALNKLSRGVKTKDSLFDFVFIDADKENSISYFNSCYKMVRKNGIIAADNILDMTEMKAYKKYVQNKKNVQSLTVKVGWGQELSLINALNKSS